MEFVEKRETNPRVRNLKRGRKCYASLILIDVSVASQRQSRL